MKQIPEREGVKYLRQDEHYTWQLDPYLSYVASASQGWPDDLKDLASLRRLDLSPRESLHDAWLQSSSIDLGDLRQGQAETSIEVLLLGPYHDRRFRLRYLGVVQYRLDSQPVRDDLLVHELHREDDLWCHEMLFASGSTFRIRCRAMEFRELL